MKENSIFKNPALIGYLVETMNEKDPGKQVGKTVIQKMMYFLTREGHTNFSYSMHHYGPYSSGISSELGTAAASGIVNETWHNNEGYYIKSGHRKDDFVNLVSEDEKQAINQIVKKFGKFNAVEMSIIATAFYIKENFDTQYSEIAEVVHSLKKNFSISKIKNILEEFQEELESEK